MAFGDDRSKLREVKSGITYIGIKYVSYYVHV